MTAILFHRRKTGLHRHDVGSQRLIAGVICRDTCLQWLNAGLHWTSASVFEGIAGLNNSPEDGRSGRTDEMEANA